MSSPDLTQDQLAILSSQDLTGAGIGGLPGEIGAPRMVVPGNLEISGLVSIRSCLARLRSLEM